MNTANCKTEEMMKSNVLILLAMVAAVLSANYPSIFDYRSMPLDDMGRYSLALENEYNMAVMNRTYLTGYYMYFAGEILERSLVGVRLLTVLLMVAASLVFYNLLTQCLKVPKLYAFLASLLPNLIPGIDSFPSFLSGSYTALGQIVAFSGAFLAVKSLRSKKRGAGTAFLCAAVSFYYFAFQIMDQALFLLPAFLLLFAFASEFRISRRLAVLSLLYLGVAAYDLIIYSLGDKPSFASPVRIGFPEIYERFLRSLSYALPMPRAWDLSSWLMFLIFVIVGLVGFGRCIYLAIKERTLTGRLNIVFPVIFGAAIFFGVGSVFWTISPDFANRYFHLPAFGSMLVLIYLMFLGFGCIPENWRKIAERSLLLIFVACVGLGKYNWLERLHKWHNIHHDRIAAVVEGVDYPPNSQIVITGETSIHTGGYHKYASGYFKFLKGRRDVSGLFSYRELQFYDPFRASERFFTTRMTGLDLNLPIYLYRMDPRTKKVKQMKYALQWNASEWSSRKLGGSSSEELLASNWTVYAFDLESGASEVLQAGKGLEDYELFLIHSGDTVSAEDILFAGNMEPETLKRFGLHDVEGVP